MENITSPRFARVAHSSAQALGGGLQHRVMATYTCAPETLKDRCIDRFMLLTGRQDLSL